MFIIIYINACHWLGYLLAHYEYISPNEHTLVDKRHTNAN